MKNFPAFRAAVPATLRALIHPALVSESEVLGVAPELVRARSTGATLGAQALATEGEIFFDGESLIVVAMYNQQRRRRPVAHREPAPQAEAVVEVAYIGNELNSPALQSVTDVVSGTFGVELQEYAFPSIRFNELKAEGREPPAQPKPEEIIGSQLLSDRVIRTIAVAIKASGGLLLRDLARQLPPEFRERTEEVQERLLGAGLVESEFVIVCAKTQAQVARAPSRQVVEGLTALGVKCACGRSLSDERVEEALSVTELGRNLLDKSRWLTVVLIEELRALAVTLDQILIDQQLGGDEVDCLANISGELVLFELKDKEFNLGNAYSFGAKIGIVRPDHPVIITTERVGNDAKEHFQRALATRTAMDWDDSDKTTVRYFEGVDGLRQHIRSLTEEIYINDARTLLDRVLPLATLSASAILARISTQDDPGSTNSAAGD